MWPPPRNDKPWWEFTESAIVDANGDRWHYPTDNNSNTATRSADQDATMRELPVHAPIDGDSDQCKGDRDATKGLSQPTKTEPTHQTDKQLKTPVPGTSQLHTGLWQPPKKEPAQEPEGHCETPSLETNRRSTRRRDPPLSFASEPTGLWQPPKKEPTETESHTGLWKPTNKVHTKKESAQRPGGQWETPLPETNQQLTRRRDPPLSFSSEPMGLWQPPKEPTKEEHANNEPAQRPEGQCEAPLPETYRRSTSRRDPSLPLSRQPTGLWAPPAAQLTRPSPGLWKPPKESP